MKLTKVSYGWYASEDGTWAVLGDLDAPASKAEAESDGVRAGASTTREWQVVHSRGGGLREDHQAGETVEWVDTLREGREVVAARSR